MITFEEFEDRWYVDYNGINLAEIIKRQGVFILRWNDCSEQYCYTLDDAKRHAEEDFGNHI